MQNRCVQVVGSAAWASLALEGYYVTVIACRTKWFSQTTSIGRDVGYVLSLMQVATIVIAIFVYQAETAPKMYSRCLLIAATIECLALVPILLLGIVEWI